MYVRRIATVTKLMYQLLFEHFDIQYSIIASMILHIAEYKTFRSDDNIPFHQRLDDDITIRATLYATKTCVQMQMLGNGQRIE